MHGYFGCVCCDVHDCPPASMSVKEVLQSLVDDGLVDSDRIGTSNYFWSFPSKAANNVSGVEQGVM